MSDLSVWTPLVREITVDGRKVSIAPLKARRFSAVQVAFRPVWAALGAGTLVGEGHDAMVALLALATDAPAEWLHEQDSDDLLGLLAATLEVNADFSRRRVQPAMDRLAERIAAMLESGAPSSPGSAGSDTTAAPPST